MKDYTPAAPTVEAMLAENQRRNTTDIFDPITGEGAPGERIRVTVDGIEPPTQWIPATMAEEPLIRLLTEVDRSVDAHLLSLKIRRSDKERRRIRFEWDRIRSRHDFYFWAARFVKIKNKQGEVTPFVLNASQRRLVSAFEEMRHAGRPIRLILLKARQWGGSTATQLYMAWIQLLHRKGWNSLIVGHQSGSSAEVGGMFELLMKEYPVEMLYEPGETINPKDAKLSNLHGTNTTRVVNARNVRIKLGTAERPHSVRGGDSSMVHCTEVAFWKRTEGRTPTQMMKSATSGVLYKPLTMIVYESSANGVGNFFHSEYEAAKHHMSQFEAMFVAWYEIEQYRLPFTPGSAPVESDPAAAVPRFTTAAGLAEWMIHHRDAEELTSDRTVTGRYLWRLWERGASLEAINWYVAERTKYVDQSDMASEFPSDDIEAFANSGTRIFSLERLEEMRADCKAPVETGDLQGDMPTGDGSLRRLRFLNSAAGRLKIWRKPEPAETDSITNRYIVTVDIGGRSPKADWSVIWVADRNPMAWGGPVETVAQWRGHTDMDILAWKAAQVATYYNNALLVIESNTMEVSENERAVDGDQSPFLLRLLGQYYDNLYYRSSRRAGFHTNAATKPMVISTLVTAVRDGMLIERDSTCIDEFACYERRTDGSFGAITGKHDDMLMTRAIGLHVALHDHSFRPTRPIRPLDKSCDIFDPLC